MSLSRTRYHAPGVGSTTPLDAVVDAAEATVSRGVRELCCRLNAGAGSFARAADSLGHAAQVRMSAESLRRVVEAEGKRVLRAAESGGLEPGWRASDCKVSGPDGKEVSRVYLGADGFMVPTVTEAEKKARREGAVAARRKRGEGEPRLPPLPRRKAGSDQRYKEFKLVQFHDQDVRRRLVSVTRKDCAEAGRVMRRDARRVGFHGAGERVGIVDGAAWIAHAVTRHCLLLTALGLDFYHLAEHVHEGKRATFGEAGEVGAGEAGAGEAGAEAEGEGQGDSPGKQWAGAVLHAAKHEGYGPLWDRLVAWRGEQRSGGKRAAADALLQYVANHKGMIRYPEFLSRGWRIGSAPTESQCRAVPGRVKGPGKRWDPDNAEAVMALECLDQSRLWNPYWATAARLNI